MKQSTKNIPYSKSEGSRMFTKITDKTDNTFDFVKFWQNNINLIWENQNNN